MSIFTSLKPRVHILVIQNSDLAPGGIFAETLRKNNCTLTILAPPDGDPIPEETGVYAGLVVLGGPQHASDDDASPYFPALMELMRKFEDQDKPVAGLCLGCQLLARAYGSAPKSLGFLELGFVQHSLTREAKTDPVFTQVQLPPLMGFHEDTFDLPEHAVLLVQGDNCKNQCFRAGRVSYGFQFHFEVNHSIVGQWLDQFRSGEQNTYEEYRKDFDNQTLAQIEKGLETYIADSETFCHRIVENWLTLVNWQRRIR